MCTQEEKELHNFSPEEIKKEFQNALEFFKDLLIFGGFIFAFLLNLFYLAVEKDIAIKDAYLTIKHRHLMSEQQVLQALSILFQNSPKAVSDSGRLVLCADDLELIYLEREAKGDVLKATHALLQKKFAVDKDWEKIFVTKFSTAKNPFYVPYVEQSILYYSWAIEILSLILLSQTVQKKHIQRYIFQCTRGAKYFFPVIFVLVFIPFFQFASLLASKDYNPWLLFFLNSLLSFAATLLLFILAKKTLDQEKEITEIGFYIFISAIFIQMLSITGDVDRVFSAFSNPVMPYIRYVSWVILAGIPVLLIERIIRAKTK